MCSPSAGGGEPGDTANSTAASSSVATGPAQGQRSVPPASAAGAPRRRATRPRAAWDLSRRYDAHPISDMLYVALAERRGTQLITADDELRQLLDGFDWIVAPADLLR